jgi:hypothetical protein
VNFFQQKYTNWKAQRYIKAARAEQLQTNTQALADYKHALLNITDEMVAHAMVNTRDDAPQLQMPRAKFSRLPYVPPFDVCPAAHVMAMDAMLPQGIYGAGSASLLQIGGFPGYNFLTELTQINEYRDISETTAKHMTRKWIKMRSGGEKDRAKIIDHIELRLKELHVKEWFTWAATTDNEQGRAQLFLDFGDSSPEELKTPLLIQKEKIKAHSFKRIKGIEPITTYPANYNAEDPTAKDYYQPSAWFVYSKEIHATRLLNFVSRPVPDLLKPVYCFGGISLSQLAMPYVDYWLQTRDSVGRLLKNFSTVVFQTDMQGILQGKNYALFMKRLQLFTAMQNNQGVFMMDKNTEDLKKENTPLSGLDKLQAQAQEHMASVAKTPLTVLFGLSPVGLTATAETDITIYNNYINTQQEALFRRPLETIINIIMLDEYGEIFEDITFDFVDLVSMTEKERALIRTSNGATDVAYITAGVFSAKEVRTKVSSDPDSGFDGIDVDSPDGKLIDPTKVPPAPGKGGAGGTAPGAKSAPPPGGSTSGQAQEKQDAQKDSNNEDQGKPDAADCANPLMRDTALVMLNDARRVAMDAGLWRGNQHTGTIDETNPTTAAMHHSAIAQRATVMANRTGSRGLHEKAVAAHQRALDAHKKALLPAIGNTHDIHSTYIDAHKAAIAHHRIEAKAFTPDEVEV